MQPAATFDFKCGDRCEQGATFNRLFTLVDSLTLSEMNSIRSGIVVDYDAKRRDLTGYTARMQVRSAASSSTIVISLTTENGRIELGDDEGTIELTISATDTAALTPGEYVYDLELISGGTVERVLQGAFVVDAEVTR